MRALLSLGLDLLGHPVWLIAVTCGLVVGGWLAVIANDAAKREQRKREIDEICRETEREWQRLQRDHGIYKSVWSVRDHRVARSIVHPDDPKAA